MANKKAVDMSGLDGLGDLTFESLIAGADQVAPIAGVPKMFRVEDIEEDPNQPRKKFDLTEMRESIRANIAEGKPPIKQPISLKTHPEKEGKFLLNDGARRFRSVIAEGLTEIPGFIDETHDKYDQMVVNIQREGHTPMEIALFIAEMEAAGDKKGKIADRLGKPASFVSKHAALLEMPDCVLRLHDEGKCTDVEALYTLTKGYEKYSAGIEAFCEQAETVTQQAARALIETLRKEKESPQPGVATKPVDQFQPAQPSINAGFSSAGSNGENGAKDADKELRNKGSEGGSEQPPNSDSASNKSTEREQIEATARSSNRNSADPEKLRKAIVVVMHDERQARLILDRRTAAGLAWIKYDDNGEELETDITQVKLSAVIEG